MAKGNFIEYVISDDPNKYPNESEQDGYYYKKVIKFETEEQTITAGTTPIEVIPSAGKLISKVNINPTPTEEKTVIPTTEDLIVAPVEGKYLSQVTVQGDANFLEENIAEGITMWGKTGTHQGGGAPGQYVWSKQFAGSNYTSESKSTIYTLTNDSIESVDIEYSTTAPVYNIETKKWDMADSTIITLINTDNFIPNIIAQKVYMRINSEPNIWYLYSEKDPSCPFSVGSASSNNTYTKTFTYSTKNTAAIDSSYIEYVTGETEADYPDGGWMDGAYYKKANIIVDPKLIGKQWEKKLEYTTTNGYLDKIRYANGIWFALQSSFGHYYSLDNGETWVESSWRYTLNDIVYHDGLFVAGSRQDIEYSLDGINWTQSNVTSDEAIKIFFHDGLWIALGSSSSPTKYSLDGKIWTNSNITDNVYSICYGEGKFVIGGYNGKYYHSTDGKTWTTETNYSLSSNMIKIFYHNGIFISVGSSGLWYSTNAIDWTQSNVSTNAISNLYYIDDIFYAPAGVYLYYSIDGKNWAKIDYNSTNRGDFLQRTDKLWITTVYNNGLYYSEDLQNWIQTNITENQAMAICYANDACIASFYKYENSSYTNYLYRSIS